MNLTEEAAAAFSSRIADLRADLVRARMRAMERLARLDTIRGEQEALETARSVLRQALLDALGLA